MRVLFQGWLFFGAAILILSACQQPSLTNPRSISGLQKRILPPNAKVVNLAGPTESKLGLEAMWEFETGMTWSTYTKWVRREFQDYFRADPFQGSVLILRKSLPGDALTLEFEKLSEPPLHVRVTFTAFPN